jgi:hypothetical protein
MTCDKLAAHGSDVGIRPIGSCAFLILLAKFELRKIDVWYECESRVCPHTNSCKTDFASSIKNDDEPQNYDAV